MRTRHEENKLRALGDDLREFKSASKKLQGDEGITLLDYLAADAAIVKSPAFENACVKVLLGNEAALTSEEQKLLSPFAVRAAGRASADAGEDDNDRAGFADRALRARKKQRVAVQVYRGVRFIPPTSNAVERLFSKARHVLSLHRHSILPIRLEMLLFLKINRRFWGAATVSKVVNA
ncbi:hypothetical protein PF005_g4483 [Phytophthora fragariae]|nr:hypothetical protein PF003_g12317 [Phytophthora fragariae]KAE8942153.1 hypothetical protein PF009_g8073 [Phytophthora fragariae]KAE9228022.1 hypothetical protein PF005_g4483 [Phytophthora fragariae]